MTLQEIPVPGGPLLSMIGPPHQAGPLPALFYFSLSARDSLLTDPYCQPVVALKEKALRIFSLDLPEHEGGKSPFTALERWALALKKDTSFLTDCIEQILKATEFLFAAGWASGHQIGVMGLSRGALIATLAAGHCEKIGPILGFAPLTRLSENSECQGIALAKTFDLDPIISQLIGKPLRFYIGNRDLRVSTERCFHFIHTLTESSYTHKIRSPQVELRIFPSIGYLGHGTPPEIFNEGATWLAEQLQET